MQEPEGPGVAAGGWGRTRQTWAGGKGSGSQRPGLSLALTSLTIRGINTALPGALGQWTLVLSQC